MIFIKNDINPKGVYIYYKQSMLSVDSSALHIFIENIVKSLYLYVSDEIKLID